MGNPELCLCNYGIDNPKLCLRNYGMDNPELFIHPRIMHTCLLDYSF